MPPTPIRRTSAAWLSVVVLSLGLHSAPPADRVLPNDNRVPAGVLRNAALTLHLEARDGTWFPDEAGGPSLTIATFAEVGRAPRIPGPLIRVPAGTTIHVSVRNSYGSTLVVHGLHSRPRATDDSMSIAPGATAQVAFIAGVPGTYLYWGTLTPVTLADRGGIDSQLHGAFVIDPAGETPPSDRIFVLGGWAGKGDSVTDAPELRVINGLSWPHTERLTYTVGDTIRWRWLNPSDSPHPVHLHGFYFDVTSRGNWLADTAIPPRDRSPVVTEMPLSGETFAMTWIPTEPGNWLAHCHIAFHTSLFLSAGPVNLDRDPVTLDAMDPIGVMRGMVLALTVNPGRSTARRPEAVDGARAIRLIAQAAPRRWRGDLDEMAFVQQEGNVPPAPDSVPTPSSLLVLRRGEPVRITVVNHTRAPTGVHWHGIELSSYADGVGGWSGIGTRRAPMIAPGDSFVAAFTPPRAGTFIYHAHSNEFFQVSLGLYGALLVVDSARYDPARERIIVLGGDGPGTRPGRINGRSQPDTMRMRVGETYRVRLIDIFPDWTLRVSLTRGDSVVHWRALAKDGADLPSHMQVLRSASFITGPGQTEDFEYRPSAPGIMVFHVRHRVDPWGTDLPIRVDP